MIEVPCSPCFQFLSTHLHPISNQHTCYNSVTFFLCIYTTQLFFLFFVMLCLFHVSCWFAFVPVTFIRRGFGVYSSSQRMRDRIRQHARVVGYFFGRIIAVSTILLKLLFRFLHIFLFICSIKCIKFLGIYWMKAFHGLVGLQFLCCLYILCLLCVFEKEPKTQTEPSVVCLLGFAHYRKQLAWFFQR